MKKITDSEREVLDLLWDVGEPLTSSEMVKMCVDRTWKPSYIHIMIKSLLDKEMIKMAGFKKTTKNYARTFDRVFTFLFCFCLNQKHKTRDSGELLKEMLASILQEDVDESILDELSEAIAKRKTELHNVS